MTDENENTGEASTLNVTTGSAFAWIVDRPPTQEDADWFGNVAVARWHSAYAPQNWTECAEGFMRPWATIQAADRASIEERRNGYPEHFTWSNASSDARR